MANLTSSSDDWLGTASADILNALEGDDTLDGGLGNDSLVGGLGNDLIAGGEDLDTIRGGDGADVLDGGSGADYVFGDAGNDIIYGGLGLDRLYGGANDDFLDGGAENDILLGGAGSDALFGGEGADILVDADSSTVYGTTSTEMDEMTGGAGNDTFYGGYDSMWGDDGNDTFNVKNQGVIFGGTGNDAITLTNTNTALASWLEGGLGSDKITAGSGNDTIISGYGKDTLIGGDGNDSYVVTFDDIYDALGAPGVGADAITEIATGGNDTIYYIRDFVGDGRDDDRDADGKELDPLSTTIDYGVVLAANVENGVLDDQIYVTNPKALNYTIAWLTGNDLNNSLQGSNLDDILDGAGGNDTISAGDGNDIIFAGLGTDVINGGAGTDLVASSINFSLVTQSTAVENIDLLDFAGAIVAMGNSSNNVLTGNKFANSLAGGAGNDTLDGWFYSPIYAPTVDALKTTDNDTLSGGTGNDTYRIDSVNDTIIEVTNTTGGIDTVEFKGAVLTDTYILSSGVENLNMLGNLKTGIGNNLNNRIIGDLTANTANILKGGYGDDFLDGGLGIDNFEGGYGDDTYVVDSVTEAIKEISGQGSDWVQSATISLDLNTPNWGGSIENARLTGLTGANLTGSLTGSTTNNHLVGNTGGNVLDGRGGIDTLEGGLGDDIYYVDTTTDTLLEVANAIDATSGKIKAGSFDTIQSSVNFSLVSLLNFENISLAPGSSATTATGNTNDNLIKGNDLANTLTGLAGDDTLDGSAGIDTLIGGQGNDTYRLSNDGDVVTELAGVLEGSDTIETSNTFSIQSLLTIENLTLLGTTAINGTGNSVANIITGNSAINTLWGLEGNDTLKGGEEADTLIGGQGADTIDLTESLAKNDRVQIAAGDSLASVSEADRIIKFAMLNDTLDLAGSVIAGGTSGTDGVDSGFIKSHYISNGIIKFDDTDTYAAPYTINSTNIASAIDYLKANITGNQTVAFQFGSDTWLFQDNGATDTLLTLVGVATASSLSTGAFSTTAIHII